MKMRNTINVFCDWFDTFTFQYLLCKPLPNQMGKSNDNVNSS